MIDHEVTMRTITWLFRSVEIVCIVLHGARYSPTAPTRFAIGSTLKDVVVWMSSQSSPRAHLALPLLTPLAHLFCTTTGSGHCEITKKVKYEVVICSFWSPKFMWSEHLGLTGHIWFRSDSVNDFSSKTQSPAASANRLRFHFNQTSELDCVTKAEKTVLLSVLSCCQSQLSFGLQS